MPVESKFDVILRREQIKGIVALVENFELKNFAMSKDKAIQRNIAYLHLPVKDFFYSPSLDQVNISINILIHLNIYRNHINIHALISFESHLFVYFIWCG